MQHINTQESFSRKVMSAFEKINSNPIGEKLLDELSAKIDPIDPLVIMPRDIIGSSIGFVYEDYKNLNEQEKGIRANNIKYGIPNAVFKLLSTFPPVVTPQDHTWLDNFLVNVECSVGSFFSNKCVDQSCYGLPHNTVMLNFGLKEPKLFGFSKKLALSGPANRIIQADENIQITQELEHEDDITLFHELNHARHWIYEIGTYNKDGGTKENRSTKDENHSSLGIQITGIEENTSTMVNSEEELQLTGFTQLKDGEIIRDYVNEIAYRFNSGRHIRFPYNMEPNGSGTGCYILFEHLKSLLEVSLKQVRNVFFVD